MACRLLLGAMQALLRRLERRLSVAGVTVDGAESLLRQLSPSAPHGSKLERYPVRVMLCAYMIKEHPEVVFNSVVGACVAAASNPGHTCRASCLHESTSPVVYSCRLPVASRAWGWWCFVLQGCGSAFMLRIRHPHIPGC